MRQIPKRPVVLLLTLLSTLPFAAAHSPTAVATPATKKAIFWKASSPTSVTYLLGSIHLGTKDMYPLPVEIEDAFAGSVALLVEADVRHLDMSRAQAVVLEKGLYPTGDS